MKHLEHRAKSAAFIVAVVLVLSAATHAQPSPSNAGPAPGDAAAKSRTTLGDTGMTPEQLRARLRDAGQSDEAIDRYLGEAGLGKKRPVAPPPEPTTQAPDPGAHVAAPAVAPAPTGPEPFGMEIFRWAPSTFEPLSYGPVDAAYPLGPGDELVLTLWGDDQTAMTLPVNREGDVTLPDVGQVQVSGLTLEEAKARLRAGLSRAYSGLRPAGQRSTTFLSLSLGKLRTIQVFLLGQVTRPGGYTISSVSRVLNALYAAGGPTRDGSLREVRILRGGRIAASVDLYDVILGGAAATLERLQNGDVVFVPPVIRRVIVAGPVRRAGIYELHADEKLRALVRIAGGLLPEADVTRAQVQRVVPPALRDSFPGLGRYALDVPLGTLLTDSTQDIAMLDGDSLTVFPVSTRRGGTVSISGRGIAKAGAYQFRPGMRVSDLLAEAGGVTSDAYLDNALITRTASDSTRMALRFAPSRALKGEPTDDLALQAMDDLSIRSQWDLKARQEVTVHGLVHSPGRFELLDDMTLADALMRAGGFTDDAFAVRAEVARLVNDGRITDTLQIPIDRDLAHSPAAQAFKLQPHDAIFIRRNPDYVDQQFVTVEGEVRFPGTYALTRRDERLADVVHRAGGLTDLAYSRGASFLRAGGGRLAVDLTDAIKRPRRAGNIALLKGDTLRVPRYDPTVQVEGAVLTPVTALYQQGAGVRFYITQASGFRQDADRGAVIVISPNGHARRGGSPEPGSRVIVPVKSETDQKDHLKDFATLMSILASAATTIFLVNQSSK